MHPDSQCTVCTDSALPRPTLPQLCPHFRLGGPGQDQRAQGGQGGLQTRQQGPEQRRQPPALSHREQHRLLQGAGGQGETRTLETFQQNF